MPLNLEKERKESKVVVTRIDGGDDESVCGWSRGWLGNSPSGFDLNYGMCH